MEPFSSDSWGEAFEFLRDEIDRIVDSEDEDCLPTDADGMLLPSEAETTLMELDAIRRDRPNRPFSVALENMSYSVEAVS